MFERFFRKRRVGKGMEIEDAILSSTQKVEAIIERPFKRKGLANFWYSIVFALFILAARLFYLEIYMGDHYEEIAKGNRIRSVILKAPRGEIKDRYGKILARNMPSIDAIIIPSDLPKDYHEKKQMAETISQVLEMNSGNLEAILASQNDSSMDPVLLKENITQDQALILLEKSSSLPGIVMEKTAIRHYESSVIFSPIMGYDGKITREELKSSPGYLMTDYIGKTGIEKTYERELRGVYGARQVEIDSLGNVKKDIGVIDPQPGNNLILNIDEDLQKHFYDSLVAILEKTGTRTAAAAAIDPKTGGVLAMVSIPSYDNNMFARGITNEEYRALINDADLPLLNRVTSGEYPPGSTLKMAVASAALSEKTISPDTTIEGLGGALHIGNFSFRDWKTHGPSDVRTAIAESNDIFFYTIGGGYGNIQGLGMSRMKKYEDLFGFGSPTGVDLPSESSGLIPDEDWKQQKIKERWYIGDSYHAAIGQGFITSTPLQLANYVAAIANGGTLYSPRIVNQIQKSDKSTVTIKPEIIRKDFISSEILNVIKEGMRKTITSGTAQNLNDLPVEVAGKTGTAQFGSEDKTHGWFVSFAPYDNPEIATVVLVEGGGEGHSSAVPVTEDVLRWYFERSAGQ